MNEWHNGPCECGGIPRDHYGIPCCGITEWRERAEKAERERDAALGGNHYYELAKELRAARADCEVIARQRDRARQERDELREKFNVQWKIVQALEAGDAGQLEAIRRSAKRRTPPKEAEAALRDYSAGDAADSEVYDREAGDE